MKRRNYMLVEMLVACGLILLAFALLYGWFFDLQRGLIGDDRATVRLTEALRVGERFRASSAPGGAALENGCLKMDGRQYKLPSSVEFSLGEVDGIPTLFCRSAEWKMRFISGGGK